ncbi:RsmB/NOP family class I SAM-dependent RNA methyltransferase [Adlercreutzia sp. ZJ138]|uniref:RsmB/NOP family class I SAM-dependent RNA methyltransferase n=1 Tax=Adlercreutzia sp. ZJ138 TaxID=2709405 RepID=UPI0013EC386B|nr:transcription antitermination factor NusB [Adlercreutzia sp. ZJ138]
MTENVQGNRRFDGKNRDRGAREDRGQYRSGHNDRGRRDERGERSERGRRGVHNDRHGNRDNNPPTRATGTSASKATPGRKAALQVLRIVRERDAFAQDVIAKHIDRSSMSIEDRAFATKLVLGVVGSVGTVDEVLNRALNNPTDIQPDVRDALRISTYEIIFLEKEPYTAVDQGVELVRSFEPKATGLANAVLRKVVAEKRSFPYGDPRTDLSVFARLHAFPLWLAEALVRDLEPQAARDFMAASNEPAPVFVAVNAARTEDDEVVSELTAAKGEPQPVVFGDEAIPGCYRIKSGRVLVDGRIDRILGQGKLIVSDASSQTVANMVLPDELPKSFLEIGAGRGTKTILIQSAAQRKYGRQIDQYVALDNLKYKTELVRERADRCGVQLSDALTADATCLDESLGEAVFDVVFIDAPCTGVGTLRRHPEIRWRLKPEASEQMAEVGLAMLRSAASHVKPGGVLAYATCTVLKRENIDVVKSFLASDEGSVFDVAPQGLFAPKLTPGSPDAHFCVKLIKRM